MEYLGWLYLVTRLDAVHQAFTAMVIFGIVGLSSIGIVAYTFGDAETGEGSLWQASRGWMRGLLMTAIAGMIGSVLIPTKQDAMFIAAVAGVIEASKALAGSEAAKTSVKVVEQWLKNELEEQLKKATPKKDTK